MQDEAVRPLEIPSDLLTWLATLERDSERVLRSLNPEAHADTLAGLASELPGYLDEVLLRNAPEEDFARHAWLAQLDRLDRAWRGCSSLDSRSCPWAPGLAGQLAEAIALRAPAAQALRDALAAEEEFDEDEGEPLENTPQMQAWETLRELRRLGHLNDLNDERDLGTSCHLAAALAEPHWVEAFQEASEAFRGDLNEREDLILWVAHGLEARLLLESIAAELLAPELFQALERVDEALNPYGDALALLPGEDYDEIASIGGFPRGWASWRETQERVHEPDVQDVLIRWGKQERAREVKQPEPSPELNARIAVMMHRLGAQPRLGVLEAVAQRRHAMSSAPGVEVMPAAAATDDATRLLDQFKDAPQASYLTLQDQLSRALQRMPCVWLRQDLKRKQQQLASLPRFEELASFLSTRLRLWPGNVPLLVAISGVFTGDVCQLRIGRRNEPGDPWESAGALRTTARDAIRAAFDAAAARMPHGLPPYPFEEHVIELVGGGPTGVQAIDGSSVGLAAALAFVSLWLDTSIPEDLACTAAIRLGGKLGPVGYVREKAEALARLAQRPVRLLLAQEPDEGLPEHIQPLFCASVADALKEAGLQAQIDAGTATYRPWMGSVADRHEMLQRYHNHVQGQVLGDYLGKGIEPWLVLGDRIRLLVRSLTTSPNQQTRQILAQGLADAALAFTHGLDTSSAQEMLDTLRELDPSRIQPFLLVFAGIAELGLLLDACNDGRRPWGDTEAPCSKLEADLAGLSQADRDLLEGRVLGTIGRVWMHQRRLPQALDYLRRAVASHDEHLWQEAGRSRIYLATALRMAGLLEEAARTLEAAGPLLDRCHHEHSQPYAELTRLFWAYEFARLLLDLGRPLDAIAAIEACLPQARQVGPWPRAGMLRTLAWAAQAASLPDRREEALRELEKIAGEDGFLRALLHEASGPFRLDGEVYLYPISIG